MAKGVNHKVKQKRVIIHFFLIQRAALMHWKTLLIIDSIKSGLSGKSEGLLVANPTIGCLDAVCSSTSLISIATAKRNIAKMQSLLGDKSVNLSNERGPAAISLMHRDILIDLAVYHCKEFARDVYRDGYSELSVDARCALDQLRNRYGFADNICDFHRKPTRKVYAALAKIYDLLDNGAVLSNEEVEKRLIEVGYERKN